MTSSLAKFAATALLLTGCAAAMAASNCCGDFAACCMHLLACCQ